MLQYPCLPDIGVTNIGSQNYDIGVFPISGAPISGKTPKSEVARIQMVTYDIVCQEQSLRHRIRYESTMLYVQFLRYRMFFGTYDIVYRDAAAGDIYLL